ncbi:MAG: hypothetical protein ACK5K7_07565 [Bacilli bacterium]
MKDVVVLVNKNGLDSSEKKYIDDNLDNILPIKKITSFLDNENFLFTKYTPSTSSVNTIVESYNGKQYHFTSMNCGYGGGGPNNLYRILIDRFVRQDDKVKYGIDNSIIWNPHIEIDFDRDGNVINLELSKKNVFIHHSRNNNLKNILVDNTMKIYSTNRMIFLLNPHIKSFGSFIKMINVLNINMVEYNINNEYGLNYEEFGKYYEAKDLFELRNAYNSNQYKLLKNTKYINLVLSSEINNISIYCFIRQTDLLMIINILSLLLSQCEELQTIMLANMKLILPLKSKDNIYEFKTFDKIKLMLHSRKSSIEYGKFYKDNQKYMTREDKMRSIDINGDE